jgi:two-component system sensor histidine kinase PilS (NtrC family)
MARELCGANDAQVRYGAIALEALLDRTGMLVGGLAIHCRQGIRADLRIETSDVVDA